MSEEYETGIVFGCWDLFHAGHAHLLSTARDRCELLIIGLHVDPSVERSEKNKPIQSMLERWTTLDAFMSQEATIIPYETEADITKILSMFEIDVRFLGDDYLNAAFTGKEYCHQEGIDIIYANRDHGFSTSELRSRIVHAELKKGVIPPK